MAYILFFKMMLMQKFNLISWLQAKDVVILPFDEIIIKAQQV